MVMPKGKDEMIVLSQKAFICAETLCREFGIEKPTKDDITNCVTKLLVEVLRNYRDPVSNLSYAVRQSFGQNSS
jgi:uncharacterized membrane protein